MSKLGVSSRSRDARGQVVVLVIVALLGLLGICAMVIDLGYLYWNQRSLQASADASALAGAMQLPDPTSSVVVAKQFGTGAGAKNADPRLNNVSESISTSCIATIPGCNPVNAVTVDETATVSTFFMRLFGLNQAKIHVRATACSPCGVKPLDIVLVLDRTGSMCQDSAGNNDPACTDMNNARNGIKTFLSYLDPKVDYVGFAVLPPATSIAAKCSTPATANYNSSSAPYLLVPLSNNFKTPTGVLNSSSNLVSTINCVQGGGGTSYANAIEAAQTELNANGRKGVQQVIVFMSDGAANTGPSYYASSSPYRTQPCHQGGTSAGYSKAKGTIVYSIGYALNDATGGCTSYTGASEKPTITVDQALQAIATSPADFYVQPNPGQLNTIYTQIAQDVTQGTSALAG